MATNNTEIIQGEGQHVQEVPITGDVEMNGNVKTQSKKSVNMENQHL